MHSSRSRQRASNLNVPHYLKGLNKCHGRVSCTAKFRRRGEVVAKRWSSSISLCASLASISQTSAVSFAAEVGWKKCFRTVCAEGDERLEVGGKRCKGRCKGKVVALSCPFHLLVFASGSKKPAVCLVTFNHGCQIPMLHSPAPIMRRNGMLLSSF